MDLFRLAAGIFLLAFSAAEGWSEAIYVDAESFEERGGWKIDTQYVPLMGSPFLMAHGLGQPVPDAVTTVTFPSIGEYRVWVRTRDWVAEWDAPGDPGRFHVVVNGVVLDSEFGVDGADWHWQDGGVITIPQQEVELRLQDQTGFNGRCDAILFTSDKSFVPPVGVPEIARLRRELKGLPSEAPLEGDYDLVVVGGGYAGMGAAISAARQSLKVALIQDRPVLGGNGSSEIRVWSKGGTRRGKFPHIGEIIDEFADNASSSPGLAGEFGDDRKEEVVRNEENIDLFLNHFAFEVEMGTDGQHIDSVTVLDVLSGAERRFRGRFFADCTGHGTIGALAGASFTMEMDEHLGMSNMWYTQDTGAPSEFPETPWALPLQLEDFPEPRPAVWEGNQYMKGEWFWESGFSKHPINDLEKIRDWNLRAVFGAFSALKRYKPEVYENHQLAWVSYVGGNRESRLLRGDVVLEEKDILEYREFPDGIVPSTWHLDLHFPREEFAKKFPDNPFISRAVFGDFKGVKQEGYPVPYRCFYSRDIGNLFMAGRCISVTHDALGTVRVMRTCGMMGEVVGKAAYICVARQTTPRGVYEDHLDQLLDLCRQRGWARRDSLNSDLYLPPGGPKFLPPGVEYVDPAELEGIVLDDKDAELSGAWKSGEGLKAYVGDHYLYHGQAGSARARYNFFIRDSGRYEVRYAYQPHENRASNAPIALKTADGVERFVINMKNPPQGSESFHTLGTFRFEGGQSYTLMITNENVDGNIHTDCVQVVPAE